MTMEPRAGTTELVRLRLETAARQSPPLLAAAGGLAIAAGACLPWMSYFAGLHPLRGIIGWNGRILLLVGITIAALAIAFRRTRRGTERLATAFIGLATIAAAIWLLAGVHQLTHSGTMNAMMVARGGPGLYVVLLGGWLLVTAAAIPDR